MQEEADILGKNFLFAQLDAAELMDLAHVVERRGYLPGEFIVKEGDVGTALYLVAKGGVNVTKSLEGHFLAYLGGGGCFGEMALFMGSAVRTANCVAALETECLIVDKAVLDRFCTSNPKAGNKIYREIIRVLAERLQATSADLAMMMRTTAISQERVSALVAQKRSEK
ncbi:MAG: cyclic nucleotide-binding domain-containing protein [Deltaproteobacteria bacterium]|nr:cyclic nucleotide-binding domain-containing protein [Deltaproteobacteria bacterium]